MALRRNLTAAESLALAESLQVAILDGIARARRWGKNEIAFQGGTCLHLAHGSPRASEDLDFVIGSDKGLEAVMKSALAHATELVRPAAGPDARLAIKSRAVDEDTGEPKNPRVYTIAFQSPAYLESVKVKVEFWVADPGIVASYGSKPAIAKLSKAAMIRRPIRIGIEQAMFPSAALEEIHADKVFALAARDYLKARDSFDLWWIVQQRVKTSDQQLVSAISHRRGLYPGAFANNAAVAARLEERVRQMGKPEIIDAYRRDLARWLHLDDSSLYNDPGFAKAVVETTCEEMLRVAELLRPAPASAPAPAARTRKAR